MFVMFINWVDVSSVCQKKGPKRRLKSRGNGAMGVGSERAVSIPQITYDHIDDSEEKKDVPFFLEEPRGAVEGNTKSTAVLLLSCTVSKLISSKCKGSLPLMFQSEVH